MNKLCFVDVETTGLDPRIHQPWELSYWPDDAPRPFTVQLPHTLQFADPKALEINHYHARVSQSKIDEFDNRWLRLITDDLTGVHLVASNPAFDASMIERVIGFRPWHHRMINVCDMAMIMFNWDRPKGLADVRKALENAGYPTTEPDHTSEQDVRAVRDVYLTMRAVRNRMPGFA